MIEGISAVGSANLSTGVRALQGPTAPSDGASFEQALGEAFGGAVNALQTGEAIAIQGIEGAATPMKVVEGVMEAQRSLQTVLAIRDKAVAAYQEIARMAI
jgi:flagellar hook-basal body complex protein FliE